MKQAFALKVLTIYLPDKSCRTRTIKFRSPFHIHHHLDNSNRKKQYDRGATSNSIVHKSAFMKLVSFRRAQPRASSTAGKSPRSTSHSTASLALSVGPEKSCLKVSTHAASLKRAYGKDNNTALSKSAVAVQVVTWSTVEINSHEVLLGDHPSVSNGPPFTIEWKAFESVKHTVAEYEECHPHHRSSEAMLMPKAVRETWLRSKGYSRRELEISTQEIYKIKELRQSSAKDGRGWGSLQRWTRNKNNAHGGGQR
jgi:hypothetical protein